MSLLVTKITQLIFLRVRQWLHSCRSWFWNINYHFSSCRHDEMSLWRWYYNVSFVSYNLFFPSSYTKHERKQRSLQPVFLWAEVDKQRAIYRAVDTAEEHRSQASASTLRNNDCNSQLKCDYFAYKCENPRQATLKRGKKTSSLEARRDKTD